jgi:hypothetical protein
VNDPMDIRVSFDPTSVHDPNFWQPLRYVDGSGNLVTPGFVGAQWQHVTTFAISPGSLRSATGPARSRPSCTHCCSITPYSSCPVKGRNWWTKPTREYSCA